MLIEIKCDKFISSDQVREPIVFKSGLNTILGGAQANNSIGKTTLLLIIDFAFGGNTYLDNEAIRQVGPHNIDFCFCFDGNKYYFSRNTSSGDVAECDENYKVTAVHDVKWFHDFLLKGYGIEQPYLTFRNMIGRFFRIYGKGNCNEKFPLSGHEKQNSSEAILDLVKLFGRYSFVKEYLDMLNAVEEKLKALTASQKHNVSLPIAKDSTQYTKNLNQIKRLMSELERLQRQEEISMFDMDLENADAASRLKADISVIKRRRTRALSQLRVLESNMSVENANFSQADYKQLLEFFPDVNIKRLDIIDKFHSEIFSILQNEFAEEHSRLQNLISSMNDELQHLQNDYMVLGVPVHVSKAYIDKIIKLRKEIDLLESQNRGYELKSNLKEKKKYYTDQYKKVFDKELRNIESAINQQMLRYNDFVYQNERKAPVLNLKQGNHYTFETPDDTGTGTSYKSLILFDLSILKLTVLPAIAHDSLLFKNIADSAIDRIMKLYNRSEKQIFIAFDKDSAYPLDTQKILKETTVIQLGENGNELFGFSWSRK